MKVTPYSPSGIGTQATATPRPFVFPPAEFQHLSPSTPASPSATSIWSEAGRRGPGRRGSRRPRSTSPEPRPATVKASTCAVPGREQRAGDANGDEPASHAQPLALAAADEVASAARGATSTSCPRVLPSLRRATVLGGTCGNMAALVVPAVPRSRRFAVLGLGRRTVLGLRMPVLFRRRPHGRDCPSRPFWFPTMFSWKYLPPSHQSLRRSWSWYAP